MDRRWLDTVDTMKLAVVGIAAVVGGLVAGTDGLVYAGAVWIVAGVLMRLVVGSPKDLEQLDGSATFGQAFSGRRGTASAIAVVAGGASVAIGLVPWGFETDDAWRWLPVALGAFMAGMQLLALLMFSAGSGIQAVTGHVGDPDHPAAITLRAVSETGVYVNERPRLALDLTVEPDGRPAYDVTIKQVVGHAELGSLRPGVRYRGLADLDRADAVRIHWHEPVGDPNAGSAAPVTDDRSIRDRLGQVDRLLRDGAISADEHAAARQDILDEI